MTNPKFLVCLLFVLTILKVQVLLLLFELTVWYFYKRKIHHHHHHHHYVVAQARIFLTLSRHFSLSFIASGNSSGLHPVSFQAAVVSIQLYGCTSWTLTKRLEKKLDSNYTRMLRAILNKSWRQHPTRHQLYGHLLPITKTIQVRRTRHAGHCWRSRDELISNVLLWTPTYGQAK